ncbi:TetR/AcrR family transcriptional regulator [Parablautia intestinalis]|uniref:TetR/AcrR family transcriptional regulator n=1 Tax=Parablautia intestinalis TaxID=2320100 RepID=A0A3A9AGR8_9FIRM|nr:TetR family transcriptional regulator [Parablautia intestinalis]MCI8613782.1 TetR/AcrR family transcriptional regulator [Lachnospiraceae bacterium]MDE7048191.1 TetR family transcriptional regulator [Lachnospiraceae bacterium]RKI90682.1 TetR/AcrR family transcriptional regulator [Parablautia intestinalis]
MARKETISREDIVQAAFVILQEEGIEQVTARKLAAKANCSTQPIFRVFKNMDELTEELFEKACDFFRNFYVDFPRQSVTPFVTLGQAYIKFAGVHKNLFEFIFLSPERFGRSMYDLVNGREGFVSREIQAAKSQGCKNASEMFMKMWIFIHGAACMTLTGDYDLSDDETMQLLKTSYQSFR